MRFHVWSSNGEGCKLTISPLNKRLTTDFQIQALLCLSTQVQVFLAMMAGWMNRQQHAAIEYLLQENRILKEQFDSTGKKLKLDNRQRRELAKRGKAMSWSDLQSYATLVRPETILAWHRKLVGTSAWK